MTTPQKELLESLKTRAEARSIRLGKKEFSVWMVLDMDALIDDVIEIENRVPAAKAKCPYGATLWPSTRAFADYIENTSASGHIKFHQIETALELGCGVGVGSCLLARAGVKKVIATDNEQHLEFLIQRNSKVFEVDGKVIFQQLDWANPPPENMRHFFPLVLACDVLYEPEHIKLLPNIARQLTAKDGVFYLADPRRFCFQSAVEELERCFESVKMTTVRVENEGVDVSQGVINRDTDFTNVEIIECRLPKEFK